VFGGGARPEYLQSVGQLMSEGTFEQPPSAEARLADIIRSGIGREGLM